MRTQGESDFMQIGHNSPGIRLAGDDLPVAIAIGSPSTSRGDFEH
jgi:hypothetical protein